VRTVARRCRRFHPKAVSMADVEGQEDATTVDMRASSSIMEASCVVPIEAVGSSYGCRGEDEDYILQVVYLFRRLACSSVFSHGYIVHIL